jgi:hypothetical protein
MKENLDILFHIFLFIELNVILFINYIINDMNKLFYNNYFIFKLKFKLNLFVFYYKNYLK